MIILVFLSPPTEQQRGESLCFHLGYRRHRILIKYIQLSEEQENLKVDKTKLILKTEPGRQTLKHFGSVGTWE